MISRIEDKTFAMRYFLIVTICMIFFDAPAQSFFDRADSFFSQYVDDGSVNYAMIRKEPRTLNALVKEIAELDLSNKRVTADYLKSFYINAYNILVIKQVVDRYPIDGPLKVAGFFDGIRHTVMGQEMTLDELEKGTLYKQFSDPRLHFVLVCAAKGCPPLVSYSYKPTGLDKQLTTRTREVLNLDWFIRVNNGKVQVSKIFEWYKGDFAKDAGSVKAFINQYRKPAIEENMKLGSYEYDWALNE